MRIGIILLPFLLLSLMVEGQNFEEESESLGVKHYYGIGSAGGGVSFYDFNRDGWDDLTFASAEGDSISFYINNQGVFEAMPSFVNNTCESKHILWVDYDNDGDSDLFISCRQDINRLYQNDGQMNFADVTAVVGLSLEQNLTYGVAWGDYDNDGWLDLYVTNKPNGIIPNKNKLFRNAQDGTFVDVSEISQSADSSKKPFCAVFVDFNNDTFPDIYIAQDKKAGNTFLRNEGNNTFGEISSQSNSDLIMDGMCVAVGDYDSNGFLDLYISNIPDGNKMLKNNGDETFTEVADAIGVGYNGIGWGSNFLDYDNDGDLDLYVSGTQQGSELVPSIMYTNDGAQKYEIKDVGFEADTVISFSNAVGDINNDGFPDIAVNNFQAYKSMLWKNAASSHNWIKIHLEGRDSNRDGIGSFINVYAESELYMRYTHCGIGFLGQNSQYEMIGIGSANLIDSIKVEWPSGKVDIIKDIDVNQQLKIIEGATSLPPFIDVIGAKTVCKGDFVKLETGFYQTYLWSNGETTRSIEVFESGEFSVTVTDSNGVSATALSIDVLVVDSPTIEVVSTPSASTNNTGTMTFVTSGGTAPYLYSLNNRDFFETNTITNLPSGPYAITVVDSNGCTNTANVDIAVVSNSVKLPVEYQSTIYPNPVSDELIIESTGLACDQVSVNLFDLLGNKIPISFYCNKEKLYMDVKKLKIGVYYLKIKSNNHIFAHYLMKN
jgi:hypothetical protein